MDSDILNTETIASYRPKNLSGVKRMVRETTPVSNPLGEFLGEGFKEGLTRTEMYRLVSAVMAGTEEQLETLLSSKNVPVVIKTIVRRVLDDSRTGDIEAVEKLWDRIFGKTMPAPPQGVQADASQAAAPAGEVLSRESYVYIRDTLLRGSEM